MPTFEYERQQYLPNNKFNIMTSQEIGLFEVFDNVAISEICFKDSI